MKLSELSRPIAKLVQLGLTHAGYYSGTCKGSPGKKTQAAFDEFRKEQEESVPPTRGASPSKIASRMAVHAAREIGVREQPKDSNEGKQVEEYQAATWLKGTGWAWCAAFICWCAKKADMPDGTRPRYPGAWAFEKWAANTSHPVETIKPVPPNFRIIPGDILVLKKSHICLAAGYTTQGAVATIEGNTNVSGSRDGGGVYARTRKLSKIRSVIRIK